MIAQNGQEKGMSDTVLQKLAFFFLLALILYVGTLGGM